MDNDNIEELKIRIEGDPVLRQKAEEVTIFESNLKKIIQKMSDLMYKLQGIGLAANQVGILKRIFIVDPFYSQTGNKNLKVFINPEIIYESSDILKVEEGCLSVPGEYYFVNRPDKIIVEAKDIKGRKFSIKADNILSRVIQHEYDHLNGILFIDKISRKDKIKHLLKSKIIKFTRKK